MSKFRVVLKIQGFEMEIEGSRTDVPAITRSLSQQIAGLLLPAAQIADASSPTELTSPAEVIEQGGKRRKHGNATRRVGSAPRGDTVNKDVAIDWVHDSGIWGTPMQSWSTATKSIWLLYVVEKEKGISELAAANITATFNKHFKQAKRIMVGNVSRDLGKLKMGSDAPVSEDTTKSPSTWFLTNAGKKKAESLVAGALGKADVN